MDKDTTIPRSREGPRNLQYNAINHPNLSALLAAKWQAWHTLLATFTAGGVDAPTVKKMYIGVGDRQNSKPGGAGTICVDDIMLTRRTPRENNTPP